MVDRFYAPKLGISHLGQAVEIQGVRARVVGFTEGIRTFTTLASGFCLVQERPPVCRPSPRIRPFTFS